MAKNHFFKIINFGRLLFAPVLRLFSLLFICLAFLFSCTGNRKNVRQNTLAKRATEKNTIAANKVIKPKPILISTANTPKKVTAGKPENKINILNGGTPFFFNYGTEQGLPITAVSCSLVDHTGSIWFGTEGGGLSRYNGSKFTNYNVINGLAGNLILSLAEDRAGNIWVGTSVGLSKFDGKSFKNYISVHGLVNNQIWSILQDKSGKIWFGTYGGGACCFNGKKFTVYTTAQGLAGNIVRSIIQDSSGNIWFATEGGASEFDGKRFINFTKKQGLADGQILSILQDKDKNIWFATMAGKVCRYDGKAFFTLNICPNRISEMTADKHGDIWFGTNGLGIYRYDGKVLTNYTAADGLADNNVQTIALDQSGNLWFGTAGGGVSRYSGRSLENFNTRNGRTNKKIWGILQDKTGNIWFGTEGGGVLMYNGQNFANYTTAQGLSENTVWNIIQDKDANLWFGTDSKGAVRFNGKTFTSYSTAQGLPANPINCIFQDKGGNVWFGTFGGGAGKFDGKSFTNFTKEEGIAGNTVQCIFQDASGDIWFGTDGDGVSRYNGKTFSNYSDLQGLAGKTVYCILQDSKSDIWFGTQGGGASRFDGRNFINYTTEQGLADNTVYGMAEDRNRGMLWFGTNLGLSALKLSPAAKSDGNTSRFEIFNENTGYPIKDLNTNSLLLDKNGIIWAGCGDNKLIRFDYSAVIKNQKPLNLQIQNIKVNNANVCWNNLLPGVGPGKKRDSLALVNEMVTSFGRVLKPALLDSMRESYQGIHFDSLARFYAVPYGLVLPNKYKNITVDFTAIEPGKPKQVIYQYKLEGYDKDWSPPGNTTTAVFGNIPEGKYTFKLKALSPDGVWSSISYSFSVLPPWYRTWWAYTVYTLILVFTVFIILRWRSAALLKANRILEHKVKTRTEEVVQQNDAIKRQKDELEKAFTQLKITQAHLVQAEKMASLGELTAGIAHEIQNPLNFVNNFSDVNKEMIDELKDELIAGNVQEALVIADDIKLNEQKINHHGKRADAIVKGMLEHSRTRSGQKEPTDINALADEYLRLSYHGLRAKDKNFNAGMTTHLDPNLPKANVIPQDIGRVLLNLFNNAFYAVNQKTKTVGGDYKPEVSVTTSAENNQVVITVKDNGVGIPDAIKEKIMQPFFTTKPSGEGTGLGLSLTYDMVVKGHGGNIQVDSVAGEGSEFIVMLPVS